HDRHPLQRPLIIVTGFMDPGLSALAMRIRFGGLFDDRRIITVQLADCYSVESCRKKVIAAVDRAFASTDAGQTTQVDVIGYSLGGVVARYAALAPPSTAEKRLRISRLFTI